MQNNSYVQVQTQVERIDIDFFNIFRGIIRQWWVIILITIATYMLAYVYTDSQYVPKYTTSATFIISQRGNTSTTYTNIQSARETALAFTTILSSNVLQKKVAEELGLESLNASVSAEVISETNLIVLSVTADSAHNSFRILQSMLENHELVSQYLLDDIIMDTIQAPSIPMGPINYNDSQGQAKRAALLGAAAAIAICGGFAMIRDTVKSSKEMNKKLDAQSLGTIYQERKHKTLKSLFSKRHFSMLISNPLLSFKFVESYQLLAARIRGKMKRAGQKILLITSVMENEGKSTVAANIAMGIAESGDKVLLVDCDMRKPAQYKIFGVEKNEVPSLGKVLQAKTGNENLIVKINNTKLFGIFNAEYQRHSTELIDNGMLQLILDEARKEFDYIIIDSSPMALVADAEVIAKYADASMLVVKYDFVMTKDINDTIDILNAQKAKFVGCLLNVAAQGLSGRQSGYSRRYNMRSRIHRNNESEEM